MNFRIAEEYSFEDYVLTLNNIIKELELEGITGLGDLGIGISDLPFDNESDNLAYIYEQAEKALDAINVHVDLQPQDDDVELFTVEPPANPQELNYEEDIKTLYPDSKDTITDTMYDISESPDIVQDIDELLNLEVTDSGEIRQDVTYNTFKYLRDCGFTVFTWYLSREWMTEEEKRSWGPPYHCMCDTNHGQQFHVQDAIEYADGHASERGYSPSSPIYALANHPDCACVMHFRKSEIDDIPLNPPGIGQGLSEELKQQYREKFFNNLPDNIYINAKSLPPLDYLTNYSRQSKMFNKIVRKKVGEVSEKNFVVIPVKVDQSFYFVSQTGILNKVGEDYKGFIISEEGLYCDVFLYELGFIIKTYKKYFQTLELSETNKKPNAGDFIVWKGKLGIISYGNVSGVYAFIPKLKKIKRVDDFKILV